jgi:hypothetical protein
MGIDRPLIAAAMRPARAAAARLHAEAERYRKSPLGRLRAWPT